jgi:hypothetical protein
VTGSIAVVLACTAAADDHGMRALRDVATAAGASEYRIIGGHMVRFLRHAYRLPGTPRLTSDTDTGIDVNVAAEGGFHDQLTGLGYKPEYGNRYVLGDQAVDLLVPTQVRPGKRIIGERAFDGAPGLRLALAVTPIQVAVTARLTDGDTITFEIPVPDVEAAFVLKMLARTVRASARRPPRHRNAAGHRGHRAGLSRITVANERPEGHEWWRARGCGTRGGADAFRSADDGACPGPCAAPASRCSSFRLIATSLGRLRQELRVGDAKALH